MLRNTAAVVVVHLAVAAYWAAMFVSTHLPPRVAAGLMVVSDKLLHAVGYAGLAFGLACCARLWRRLSWGRYTAIFLCIALYAAIDETTQAYVGRSSELLDWAADCAGAFSGLLLFALASWPFERLTAVKPKTQGSKSP